VGSLAHDRVAAAKVAVTDGVTEFSLGAGNRCWYLPQHTKDKNERGGSMFIEGIAHGMLLLGVLLCAAAGPVSGWH